MAKASETALHRSTSGCNRGRLPSLRKRRSSDSAAQRYWVGFRPIGEGAPPGLDLGKLALRAGGQPGAGSFLVLAGLGLGVGRDALGVQDAGDQGREVAPEGVVVPEVH